MSTARPVAMAFALLASLTVVPAVPCQNTTRVSVTAAGAQVVGFSEAPDLSHTGRFVAFASQAPSLVPGDVNGDDDVFVLDRALGTLERVSVSTAGVGGNSDSRDPSISADGRKVAFVSFASNLDPLDVDGSLDIYVRDRVTGTTTLATLTSDGEHPAFGASEDPEISADGRFVVFESAAKFVDEDNGAFVDIYLRDLQFGVTTLVNVRLGSGPTGTHCFSPGISGDGRLISYDTTDDQIVVGDTNSKRDVFVRDLLFGATVRASVSSAGVQGDDDSEASTVSDDGKLVAFVSRATNLVPGDTNGVRDIFVRDLLADTTTRVSLSSSGIQGNGNSLDPEISADGRYVTFRSLATNLVTGDTNGKIDDFLHDRVTGVTTRLSVSTAGAQSDATSNLSGISGDGRYAAFDSTGTNLVPGDTNGSGDVFLRALHGCSATGGTTGYGAGLAGAGGFLPAISVEGCPSPGASLTLRIEDVRGGAAGGIFLGFASAALPFKGGLLLVDLQRLQLISVSGTLGTPGAGTFNLGFVLPSDPQLSGASFYVQAAFADSAAPSAVSLTRGLQVTLE